MPACRQGASALAVVALLASAGCGDDGGSTAEAGPPSTVPAGPVAAVAVVPGDCLDGVVLGVAERREIESTEVVSCEREHGFEVFAAFELGTDDLEVDDLVAYPGPARVVRAAEEGCTARIEELAVEPDAFGVVALWPSAESWVTGDRTVACAVFSPDGVPFEGRQL